MYHFHEDLKSLTLPLLSKWGSVGQNFCIASLGGQKSESVHLRVGVIPSVFVGIISSPDRICSLIEIIVIMISLIASIQLPTRTRKVV